MPFLIEDYLRHYGFTSVEEFQKSAGLSVDGVAGPKTMRAAEAPRCGVREDAQSVRAGADARDPGRDYAKEPIVYDFEDSVPGLSDDEAKQEFQVACDSWAAVCGVRLRLRESGESNELRIQVKTRRNDRTLDGPGRTLAYAYVGGSLMVFDGDEPWRINRGGAGIYFQAVACHELGHIINFLHSQVQTALMAPYYSSSVWRPVSPDDVERGVKVYGKAEDDQPPPTPGNGFSGRIISTYSKGLFVGSEVEPAE